MTGILVLITAFIIGGLFAWLGSVFGRTIGRRKISFWGLRPRYTSLLVTIFVGMFTSLFTIVLIASFSQRAKTALVGFGELQKEKKNLEEQIQELSEIHRKSSALFHINEPVSSGVVQPDSDIERQLGQIVTDAAREVQRRSDELAILLKRGLSEKGHEKSLMEYDPKDFAALRENLAYRDSGAVVLVYSEKNVYFGEKVKVKFSVFPNVLLVKKGEKLLSAQIQGAEQEEKIFFALIRFLRELEQYMEKKGMLRIPGEKPLIDVSSQDIFSTLQQIKGYRGLVEVSAYAVDDLYTTTPVNIRLQLNRL
jgi:hypothetical protein